MKRFELASSQIGAAFLRLGLLSKLVGLLYGSLTAVLLAVLLLVAFDVPESAAPLLLFIYVLHRLQPRLKSIDAKRIQPAALLVPMREASDLLTVEDQPANLPQQYDTHVGDRANRLSDGPRQRIALARALIRCPAAPIVDVSTSCSLDQLSESLVSGQSAGCRFSAR